MAGGIHDLGHFCGRHILAVDAADAFAVQMNLEHDLGRRLTVLVKELLQNHYHKFHGGVVIIEHHDLEHARGLYALRPALKDHRITRIGRAWPCGGLLGILGFPSGHEIILSTAAPGSGVLQKNLALKPHIGENLQLTRSWA